MTDKPIFIFDWATCNNYFAWFYGENTTMRDNLFKLHLKSAMSKATHNAPLIFISGDSAERISTDYVHTPLVVDTFLEAVEVKAFPERISRIDLLTKMAGAYSLTKRPVFVVVSDAYIYNFLKNNSDLNVINLKELTKVIEEHKLS